MQAGKCEKYALLTEIITLSLFFFNHCHSCIAVHFFEILFLLLANLFFLNLKIMLFFG